MRELAALVCAAALVAGGTSCTSKAQVQIERADYRLTVSPDGHHILKSDGSPFFWLGDTAWELFHRLDREEIDFYLEDRANKGFNVIQAVVLAELDGLRTPNAYGEVPLIELDPELPNEAYFAHVDYVVERAAALGMHVGMLPTWGDKFNLRWGVGPEIFTPENARAYGQFLGARYANDPVIWILGGDRNPEEEGDLEVIRSMARGIRERVGDAQMMTYHPMGGSKSWTWFHDDEWLDLNMFQSGHGARDQPNYQLTAEGYALEPVKPVLDGEPRYEDHPVDWSPEKGWFDAFDVRQAAYWSILAGAAGHTYGNHNIWQMWEPGREPISSAQTPWREAVHHPGSSQMGLLKAFFETRQWMRLVPDQSLIVGEARSGGEDIRAAREADGSFAVLYTPYGHALVVDLTLLSADSVNAAWFDPRDGEYIPVGRFETMGGTTFDPPGEPERGNDWVLVLE